MSERDSYNPGEFCWVDLASPDLDASKAFYADLIGWDLTESPDPETYGNYGMFTYNGKVVGGLGPLMSEGQPPAWASYVCVEDVGETQKKVEAAGGQVMMGDIEIPGGVGSMAVCADPEGAVFCLWQPGSTKGAQLVNEVGTWTWNQLSTRDLEGAKRFYGEVFGWTAEEAEEAPPDSPYLMWQVEGQKWDEGLAGVMVVGGEISLPVPDEVPAHWMVYLAVADCDQAIETVKAGGGQLTFGPQVIPVGKLAVFIDPQGAAISVIEPDYPEAR